MTAQDNAPLEEQEAAQQAEPQVVEAEVIEPEEAKDTSGEDEGDASEPESEVDAADAEPVDELAQAKQEAADARDSYLRLKAEWDNFRKRTAAEREQEKVRASEKLVKDLIPVIDDLERAIDHAKQSGEGGSLTEGVEAVLAKWLQIFEKHKVTQIEAVGEQFDPNKHQAVGTQPDDSVPEETVLNVYQKGYQMGERVLRPAMVVTSTK